jgi:hypothetical protein
MAAIENFHPSRTALPGLHAAPVQEAVLHRAGEVIHISLSN